MIDIEAIHCIADELRLTPARKITKVRLVELGEMLEMACKDI